MDNYETSADKIDPYYHLANAIILQAVRDYRSNVMDDDQLRRFLLGDWFMFLTKIDGEYLYKNLLKERDEKYDSEGIEGKN